MGDIQFDKEGKVKAPEPSPWWQVILLFICGTSIGLFIGKFLSQVN